MYSFTISGFSDEICNNFTDQLRTVKELGLSHISIRWVDQKYISEYTLTEVKTYIMPLLKQYGIGVSSIGSSLGKVSILDVQKKNDFQEHLMLAKHIAEIAHLLEAPFIRFFSFFIPSQDYAAHYRSDVIEKVQALSDVFEQFNVVGLHENEVGVYGDTLERCLDLIDSIEGKGFASLMDFANFVHCGQDPIQCYMALKPVIRDFHVKDAIIGTHDNVLCGTGDGRIAQILQLAADDGYQGYLTLEPHLVPFSLIKELKLRGDEDLGDEENLIFSGKPRFAEHLKRLRLILAEIRS